MDVYEAIVEMVADHTDCDPSTVTRETTFESLGIDSLDTVEMVMELEDKLEMEIELDRKVATIGELVDFIEALR